MRGGGRKRLSESWAAGAQCGAGGRSQIEEFTVIPATTSMVFLYEAVFLRIASILPYTVPYVTMCVERIVVWITICEGCICNR